MKRQDTGPSASGKRPAGPTRTVTLTAAHVATALVAACHHVGVSPMEAYEHTRKAGRARRVAAAACVARLGVTAAAAATVFRVQAIRLAPTKLVAAGITTEDLLVVAEALESAGLTGDDDGGARFRSPWEAASPVNRNPEPATRRTRPGPPRAPVEATSKAEPKTAPVERPSRISTPDHNRPTPTRWSRPLSPKDQTATPLRPRSAIALKPITDRGARFIRRFMDSGAWRVEEVADLFDTSPDAIARVLNDRAVGLAA